MEEGLLLIQKMHKEGNINDDQRDALKGKYSVQEALVLPFGLRLIGVIF